MIMNILFDKELYNLDAIKRASILYTDVLFLNLTQDDKHYVLEIENKDNNLDVSKLIKEIKNKVIEEEVRIKIEIETKTIRESLYESAIKNITLANEDN